MPVYAYYCNFCHNKWSESHGFFETPLMCPACESSDFEKQYNYVSTINKPVNVMESNKKKVGAKTREFIEQSRQDLKDHKAEKKQ